uniref:Apoptosis inhibitor 5 n=2 Tax=Plectus sambesii TaxID=2011161 RepID=A0A914XBW0_9BILA
MAVTVEKLYELCEKLDSAKDKITEHQEEYQAIIAGTKGGSSEKRLAAQFIVRYFHRLPDQQLRALDALFELCEDDDVNIRKVVIKDLPGLCKGPGEASEPQHVDKVADVLTQLLQTEDSHEQTIVQNALVFMLRNYPKETLKTVFGHIMNAEEDLIRDRAVKFIAAKLKTMPPSVITREMEDFVLAESKKILQDVTGDEFILFMYILQNLPHLQTVTGRQQLLELVVEQADLDKPFDPQDPDRIDQITQCFKQAVPYLSKNVHSTKLVSYLLDNVIPNLDKVKSAAEGAELELLRVLAELTTTTDKLEGADAKIKPVFKKLLDILPSPPSESNGAASSVDKDIENEDPKIQFSEIEALLSTVHQLGKHHPEFFTKEESAEERKEFKKRLQYLARVIQVYSDKLKKTLAKMSKEDLAKEENKIKFLALRTTANISTLVKDLLRTPMQFKAVIALSWKPVEKPASSPAKRQSMEEAEAPARKFAKKEAQSVYAPPSGKFSEKAGAFKDTGNGYNGNNFNNRGRGQGRGRGRGGGRGYRGGRGRW